MPEWAQAAVHETISGSIRDQLKDVTFLGWLKLSYNLSKLVLTKPLSALPLAAAPFIQIYKNNGRLPSTDQLGQIAKDSEIGRLLFNLTEPYHETIQKVVGQALG